MWSYFTVTVGNWSLGGSDLDQTFNMLGAEGWEMVAGLSTVKTWSNMTGNRLVFVFKRPGTGLAPSAAVLARLKVEAAPSVDADGLPPSDGTW